MVRIGEGMVEPRLVRRVEPVLSEVARQARLTGAVDLDVEVGPDGRVRKVTVLTPLPLLDEAAATAVRQWEYEPPRINGQPTAVVLKVRIPFR